ncbi:hypothetical protein BDF20DRAFT_818686 [Mycotypha africana]|uniref:uncharacterized protein n=1 Tax=Mycotypha africana TaxID=64632 RepID=UPI0023018BDD|nr:uncharacterized protein BDF20DRAFT_818686 [Mycotypha africana]KAI8982079.1 hypothetical protein BDF20DRAFT_818686 [Mycotypha africana]
MSAEIAATASTEWDRLWQVVRNAPDDFTSWEQLIRLAEAPEGGLTKDSPPENIARLESVYDSFLAKFPLCFGYWKKYADWELAVHGDEGCEKTYERGVAAIHNSIDLWNHYIDYKIAQSASNEEIERLMERAASNVGLDFLAHPFWDKYLNFAEKQFADSKRVLALLDRIVLIPMHQYARYYEKWRALRTQGNNNPSEVLDVTTLNNFTREIQEEKGNLSQEDLDKALREKMDAQTAAIYKNTQEGTNKRWVYEAEIKRSYFHVKPLDRPQLQNWNKYLDFEESVGDIARIRALYERCLVPCAQYEEFWFRYGQWLMQNNMTVEARHAYERAAYTFLPKEKPTVKILLAQILEEEGQIDDARKIYRTILEASPSNVEAILNYIHFERRQDPSSYEGYLNSYTQYNQINDAAKAFFTVEHAKYMQQVSRKYE